MPPVLIVAALAKAVTGLGLPVAEGDLALVVPQGRAVQAVTVPTVSNGVDTGLTWEQVDVWWADEGATMIAEAVRPTPAVPAGLDAASVAGGSLAIRLEFSVSAATRP